MKQGASILLLLAVAFLAAPLVLADGNRRLLQGGYVARPVYGSSGSVIGTTRGPGGLGGFGASGAGSQAGGQWQQQGIGQWGTGGDLFPQRPGRGGAGTRPTFPAAGAGAGAGANPVGTGTAATAGSTATAAGSKPGRGNPKRDWTSSLSGLTSGAVSRARAYGRRQRYTPASAGAKSLASSLAAGNGNAAAQSLATATNQNPTVAAEGIVAAVAQSDATSQTGTGAATASSNAIAETIAQNPDSAGEVLAKGADLAVTKGYTDEYGNLMANTFGAAKRKNKVPQMTTAVTEAVSTGGENAQVAYGTAIAKAIAGGGDSKAAIAEATATAYCEGGATADSWSNAYAVAIAQDAKGCLVLNEAKALAQARCRGGQFTSDAQSEATSTVLGFCGLLPLGYGGSSFTSGSSGSTAAAGK